MKFWKFVVRNGKLPRSVHLLFCRPLPAITIPSPLFQLLIVASVTAVLVPAFASGGTEYYRHVVFDNSLNSDYYFYSWGQASKPSSLQEKNSRLPVENKIFLTPPNAIRIEWESQPGGGWEAEVRVMNFRYRFPEMAGHNLYLWCFSPEPIAATDLPLIVLANTQGGLQVAEFPGSFTVPVPLGKFAADLPGKRWSRVRIPLSEFRSASMYEFHPEYLQNVIFLQGRPRRTASYSDRRRNQSRR